MIQRSRFLNKKTRQLGAGFFVLWKYAACQCHMYLLTWRVSRSQTGLSQKRNHPPQLQHPHTQRPTQAKLPPHQDTTLLAATRAHDAYSGTWCLQRAILTSYMRVFSIHFCLIFDIRCPKQEIWHRQGKTCRRPSLFIVAPRQPACKRFLLSWYVIEGHTACYDPILMGPPWSLNYITPSSYEYIYINMYSIHIFMYIYIYMYMYIIYIHIYTISS